MSKQNFKMWAKVDGKGESTKAESLGHEGEMLMKVYQRDRGEMREVVKIECTEDNGMLKTTVYIKGMEISVKSKR